MIKPQVHSAAGRIISMKNSNDTIENRTRDRSASTNYSTACPPPPPQLTVDVCYYYNVMYVYLSIQWTWFCHNEHCLLQEHVTEYHIYVYIYIYGHVTCL